MVSRKKLTPQQKAAATRKRNRIEAERKRAALLAKRRARYATKKRAASKPKRRTTAKPSRATSSSPKPASRKPIAVRKPTPKKRRTRTPANRAEAARLGWERRREREAIQVEGGSVDTSRWVDEPFDTYTGKRTPAQREAFEIGKLRNRQQALALEAERNAEQLRALEEGSDARDEQLSRREQIQRRLQSVENEAELARLVYDLVDEDYSAREIFALHYSPDAA